jgi:hypothetical protein
VTNVLLNTGNGPASTGDPKRVPGKLEPHVTHSSEALYIYSRTKEECMNAWRQTPGGLVRHEVGAGAVAAVAIGAVSVLYWAGLLAVAPAVDVPFSVGLYMLGYTGFVFFTLLVAPLVGFVVGTAVWQWTPSSAASPRDGAFAGAVTALGTVLGVPILFGLLVAARELVGVSPALFATPIDAFVVTTRGGIVYWSLFTGPILVPLVALVGSAYQRSVLAWSQ